MDGGRHEHEHDDRSHIADGLNISFSAAIALMTAILGIGGLNLYAGKDANSDLMTRVKFIENYLQTFSSSQVDTIELMGAEIQKLLIQEQARDEMVRESHRNMADNMENIDRVLAQEEQSDQQFHRSMETQEALMRKILHNQQLYMRANKISRGGYGNDYFQNHTDGFLKSNAPGVYNYSNEQMGEILRD